MYMRANLVRDPSQTHPPKVLYLGADSTRQLAVVIDNVNVRLFVARSNISDY